MTTSKIFRRILIIAMTVVIAVITSVSSVSAGGRNRFYLSFLFDQNSRTFSSMVVQSSGRRSVEENFSRLNTTSSLIRLTESGLGGLVVNSEGNMAFSSMPITSFPFTFPEFPDVDGSLTDRTMAIDVGVALTTALNTAVQTILRPVSIRGRQSLRINEPDHFFRLTMSIANSGYTIMANNTTSFTEFRHGDTLRWSARRAVQADMEDVRGVMAGLTYRDYIVIRNHSGATVVLPFFVPKGYSQGQRLYGQQLTSANIDEMTEKLS